VAVDAVQQRDAECLRAEQWCGAARCLGRAIELDGEQHDVGQAELGRVVAGIEAGTKGASRPLNDQAMLGNRVQMGATGEGADVLARPGEQNAKIATDGAGGDDCDTHSTVSAS
jgi:hypothetical protein